jgi:hypothetical protein
MPVTPHEPIVDPPSLGSAGVVAREPAGTIHASGVAPRAIEWQLGVRPDGAPPFLTYLGDRLCQPDDASSASRREADVRL